MWGDVSVDLEEALTELQLARRGLEMAEAHSREQREVMVDLLLLIGTREVCSKCGKPCFWIRLRGTGPAVLYGLDGTQHWPICSGTTIRPAAPPILWIADAQGRCTHANNAWQLFSGYAGKTNLDESWESAIHPADKNVITVYHKTFAARELFKADYRLRRANGEFAYVHSEAEPHYNASGLFQGFAGMTFETAEISERGKAA